MFLPDLICSIDDNSASIADNLGSVLLEVIEHRVLSIAILLRALTNVQV